MAVGGETEELTDIFQVTLVHIWTNNHSPSRSWIVSLMVDTGRLQHGISNCGGLSIYLYCLELQHRQYYFNKRPTYRCLLNNQIFCRDVLYVQPVLITAEKAFCVTNWTTSNSRALEGNFCLTSTWYHSIYTYSNL